MNRFINALNVENNKTRTLNNMETMKSSLNPVVDLFFAIGASRGKDITPLFAQAANADLDLAVRIALYARDAREGMGERQQFRNIAKYLAKTRPGDAKRLVSKIPELGRFDDLLTFIDTPVEKDALSLFAIEIMAKNGLALKWAPREASANKLAAYKLRRVLGLNARPYRKLLAANTHVVEQDMCSDNWSNINFSQVPSVAAARYQNTFHKHDGERYRDWIAKLQSGDKSVKINAAAVYPYDIVKSLHRASTNVAEEQWKALPNWVNENTNFLPVVDSSGSMGIQVASGTTAMQVAVSLGIYLAQKNKSAFKDKLISFSNRPEWIDISGMNLYHAYQRVAGAQWMMNTNIQAVFEMIVDTAVRYSVPQKDMPTHILILSDMQFDQATSGMPNNVDDIIRMKYKAADYKVPNVVYWNIRNYGHNTPVTFDKEGRALVSGFSPSLVKDVLSFDMDKFIPINIVKNAVMKARYDW